MFTNISHSPPNADMLDQFVSPILQFCGICWRLFVIGDAIAITPATVVSKATCDKTHFVSMLYIIFYSIVIFSSLQRCLPA